LVLLVLMDVKAENYRAAEESIASYGGFQKNEDVLQRLKRQVKRMQTKYSFEEEEQIYVILQESEIEREKLESAGGQFDKMGEEGLQGQIQEHLDRFNHLYSAVNASLGSALLMVPKPAEYLTIAVSGPFASQNYPHKHTLVASH
jgi:hypothetical protein